MSRFSLLRSVGWFQNKTIDYPSRNELSPSLTIQLDKEIYRPGDSVFASIEISSPGTTEECSTKDGEISSLLIDNLLFEIKGIEKLDTQWFSTQKPLPGSKRRRGELLFLDFVAPSVVSKVVVSPGCSKTYIVRIDLPKILPPSYRGISIRYIYYVKSTISGRWLFLEKSDCNRRSARDLIQVESQASLQIWVSEKNNLLLEEGSLFVVPQQLDIYWREKDTDSEWNRVNENLETFEEGYDSSRDEISSVSSYNVGKNHIDAALRNSLSMQSIASRLSNNDFHYTPGEPSSFPSYVPLTQLSVAEVIDEPDRGLYSPQNKLNHSSAASSHHQQRSFLDSYSPKDDLVAPSAPNPTEHSSSEGFIRGRSYNIRIDDHVLLRFSPKNSDSTYYFGDVIGGTLTFFHGEGARRCLEVSVSLEISETITQRFVHPSRRSSPTITKVQSEHQEVVADLAQTSFLFSIPIDGPMSFSTPKVLVQWSLRFEFFTNPSDLDLTRYEHPLLIEQREKGEWVLPITVHTQPLRAGAVLTRSEKSSSIGNVFHS